MGWEIGFDSNWSRDIGYGVPAECDHPECDAKIDRGLSYVCGGQPYGEPHGCGLFFCDKHLSHKTVPSERDIDDGGEDEEFAQLCERCPLTDEHPDAFEPKPDVSEWVAHKQTDPSWAEWRKTQLVDIKQTSGDVTPEGRMPMNDLSIGGVLAGGADAGAREKAVATQSARNGGGS